MNRLEEIVARKHAEVATLRSERIAQAVWSTAETAPPTRGFAKAIRDGRPSVIAEVKQASPSRGTFAEAFDPVAIAMEYERGGASAISVLTDVTFFRGSTEDLTTVRSSVTLPVLRKDFLIDEIQVAEARAIGADAVLLIAKILDDRSLRDLRERAEAWGMDVLVEAHDEDDIRRATASGASMIGINNRDLTTFTIDLGTSERLRPSIPAGIISVSESGIMRPEEASRLFRAGFDAILVGEGLMRSSDRPNAIRQLRSHASAGPLR